MSDTTPKSPRWMRLLLIASLAVNLLVVGLFVGASFKDDDKRPQRGPGFAGDLRGIAAAMPDEARRSLRGLLERRPGKFSERRRNMGETRRAFIEGLEQEPFDISVIENAFDTQRQNVSDAAQDGYALILEAIEGMSAAERAEFAENLRKPPRQRKDR